MVKQSLLLTIVFGACLFLCYYVGIMKVFDWIFPLILGFFFGNLIARYDEKVNTDHKKSGNK